MPTLALEGVDIGNPGIPGDLIIEKDRYGITAGGMDIWGAEDHCFFAYRRHAGDFSMIVRVEFLGLSDPYAKSGIMVRESLEAGSAMAYFFVFPDNRARNSNNGGYEFHVREQRAATCKAGYPPGDDGKGVPPYPVRFPEGWIKFERKGKVFKASTSADGKSWKHYNEYSIDFPETMLMGLTVTAHNDSTSTKSWFSALSLA